MTNIDHTEKNRNSPPPEAALYQMMNSHVISRLIYVVAKLGVPDVLRNRAISFKELAKTVKAHPGALYRVMRTLAGHGLFSENKIGFFELTALGTLLRSDDPNSQRDLAILMWEPWWREGWDGLIESVMTGATAFDRVHGTGLFEYLKTHPETADLFNRAMISITKKEINSIISSYDFSGVSTVVDVGGGYGGMVAALLKRHTRMTGILYDLAHVGDAARSIMKKKGVHDRCTVAGGDFFSSVPSGGDAYILKSVIHDWEDKEALVILKNCKAAMSGKSRLLLIERAIPPGDVPSPGKIMDIVMMVNLGGRERTEEEYRGLLTVSGFTQIRVIPTVSGMNIIEAATL